MDWTQQELARDAARIGVATVQQLEVGGARDRARRRWRYSRRAFEAAGVEFIDENGGGPSIRLPKAATKRRLTFAGNGGADFVHRLVPVGLGDIASFENLIRELENLIRLERRSSSAIGLARYPDNLHSRYRFQSIRIFSKSSIRFDLHRSRTPGEVGWW